VRKKARIGSKTSHYDAKLMGKKIRKIQARFYGRMLLEGNERERLTINKVRP
jgi:hypothetical protein